MKGMSYVGDRYAGNGMSPTRHMTLSTVSHGSMTFSTL